MFSIVESLGRFVVLEAKNRVSRGASALRRVACVTFERERRECLYFATNNCVPCLTFPCISLAGVFSGSVVTCSSAGSQGSFQRVYVCVPSSSCVFEQLALLVFSNLNTFGVSSSSWFFLSRRLINGLLAMVVHVPPPHPPSFFPSTDSFSVAGCLEWGLMVGLQGFASHGSSILSRGWLATVEAPGYPRHPPSA